MAMLNKKIGEWMLGDLISDETGNGEIWHAKHSDGRQAVIKILKNFSKPAKAEKRKKRLLREIGELELLQADGFQGVMPIYDSGVYEDGRPWYAMPLAEQLVPGQDRVVWAVETMIKVTECVVELHEDNKAHRDIKPSNLLVLNGEVVISDFGLVRDPEDEDITVTGEMIGSVGYAAPECKSHMLPETMFKCDVYALAKTTWVLITGNPYPPQGQIDDANDSFASHGIQSERIALEGLHELLVASTSRALVNLPSASEFLQGLKSSIIREDNSIVDKNDNSKKVLGRLRGQFGDQAKYNKLDNERDFLYEAFYKIGSKAFEQSWSQFIDELGWGVNLSNGGRIGTHALKYSPNWQSGTRYFFSGRLHGQDINIALTFRKLITHGAPRLEFGATIAIQYGESLKTEKVISEYSKSVYLHGPDIENTRNELVEFIASEDIQFRAIEELRNIEMVLTN